MPSFQACNREMQMSKDRSRILGRLEHAVE